MRQFLRKLLGWDSTWPSWLNLFNAEIKMMYPTSITHMVCKFYFFRFIWFDILFHFITGYSCILFARWQPFPCFQWISRSWVSGVDGVFITDIINCCWNSFVGLPCTILPKGDFTFIIYRPRDTKLRIRIGVRHSNSFHLYHKIEKYSIIVMVMMDSPSTFSQHLLETPWFKFIKWDFFIS